jgi:hypothetical protein
MFRNLIIRIAVKPVKRAGRYLWHLFSHALTRRRLTGTHRPEGRPQVLVVGVYVSAMPHLAAELSKELSNSLHCVVTQAWASLGAKARDPALARNTTIEQHTKLAKFDLLNRLLLKVDLGSYDYILCVDDDVSVNPGFLDQYIALQQKFNFSICQPARTWTSHLDHEFVRRNPAMIARQTWFVEIGPIFSFSQDIASKLLPFNLETPMGWGYDFVWPRIVRDSGAKMGIIDQTPVDHTLRKRGALYSSKDSAAKGYDFRKKYSGITDSEAFVVVQGFPKGKARWRAVKKETPSGRID